MVCFMCGLGPPTVKLTQVQISSTVERMGGTPTPGTRTVCEFCKKMLVEGNHPDTKKSMQQREVNQEGFIKPSNRDENDTPPAVRPQ